MQQNESIYDAIVVGGGPAGATAAHQLAVKGHHVLLLDRAGRIKPCGGAVPPQLLADFDVPRSVLEAEITGARMISPTGRTVDMPIPDGFVGMVDRGHFDEWLRCRSASAGAERITGSFVSLGESDGELIEVADADSRIDPTRCDVIYDGKLSPDFYSWVFPHGKTLSIGTGTAVSGFSIRSAVTTLREDLGLESAPTVRTEGAPIPMKPLKRWDDGKHVLLCGDAAGVSAQAHRVERSDGPSACVRQGCGSSSRSQTSHRLIAPCA